MNETLTNLDSIEKAKPTQKNTFLVKVSLWNFLFAKNDSTVFSNKIEVQRHTPNPFAIFRGERVNRPNKTGT